jgi:hypothetical protein
MGFIPRPDAFKNVLDILGGPAEQSQYVLVVTPPLSMLAGGGLATRLGVVGGALGSALTVGAAANLAFMAESVSLPGRQFRTTNHYIYGSSRRMPVGVEYQTMMVNFICTNSMIERHFFDIWHQFIMSPRSQYMEYYNDYVGTLVVKKLMNSGLVASTTAGGPVYSNNPLVEIGNTASTYVLDEAYPISVQSQELNWSGQDYLKLTVEFTYKSWRSEPLTAIFDTGSGVGRPF